MTEVTLPLPKLDGHTAEKLSITFTGAVELDRRLDDNLELLNQLRLGQDVELVVVCRPVAKGFTPRTTGDDADDLASYAVKLKVRQVARAA
jgi:hypothetical protein